MREPEPDLDFHVEKFWNGSIALRLKEFYLSADSDGVVRNDRKVCREWEQYRLVPAPDERLRSAAGVGLATVSLPEVNLIDGKRGRFLMFDTPGGNPQRCPADLICHALAARLLGEAASGTIIDAGAGFGGFAIPIAKRFHQGFAVLSFEAQRIVFYQLCGNVIANSLGNVFPHNVGLSDVAGLVEIPIPDYAKDSAATRLSVDPEVRRSRALAGSPIATDYQLDRFAAAAITTLDSFGITDVRLIKLDVEGIEIKVLRGARETIAASGYPPILFASWEDQVLPLRKTARAELLAELDKLGYDLKVFGVVHLAQHRASRQIEITLVS
jgi:FkbM family methyltransferase